MPKGGASSLTPVYAGLQEDLDAFLKAYMTMKSIRFADYKKLFEHRGMIQLFSGRSNSAEIIEFNECLLVHCLQYIKKFVCPGVPRCLKERLFGLYSLYTFYYLQQENHVVKIRMDPDASCHFRKLTEYVLEEKILDAYMACLKLLEDKAIKHVAFIAIHDPANFKRFYTDDKATGVDIKTNLNDPMSNVKSLYESREFLKLGFIHTEYLKCKQRAGFDGCHLINIREKVNDILIQQSLEISMNFTSVDEIINTDHSSEELASRGMLRSSTKEQAYSADLKLARSRRHRSSTPLDVTTDSFDFEDAERCEIKDVKKIKRELSTESSKKRRGRRRRVSLPEAALVPSSPEEKMEKKRCRLLDNEITGSNDEPVSSLNSRLSEAEHEEELPKVDRKPDKRLLEAIIAQITPNTEIKESQEAVETSLNTPRSIIKPTGATRTKLKRHVSFREKRDGELDNTVHEIPSNSSYEDVVETIKTIKQEALPPQSDTENQSESMSSYEPHFDDNDMFKPLEMEEPDEMDDDDVLMLADSDDEMMIVDEM